MQISRTWRERSTSYSTRSASATRKSRAGIAFSAISPARLPEIVLIHDDKILLANESAASLIGVEPAQLVGRDIADLVKPAYRALFRKTSAKRLAGEDAPRRLEIQMINGEQAGLWVETQSSSIEFHGQPAVLTVARDVSQRKEPRSVAVTQQAGGAVHAGVDRRRRHYDRQRRPDRLHEPGR